MKKIIIATIACLLVAGWAVSGYCQYGDESAAEGDIEQSESAIDENLGSEISSDQAQSEEEMGEMDESMDTGGATN